MLHFLGSWYGNINRQARRYRPGMALDVEYLESLSGVLPPDCAFKMRRHTAKRKNEQQSNINFPSKARQ